MSPPGERTVFVGSYASEDAPGIRWLAFDESAATLTPVGASAGVRNPSFLTVHPGRRYLYAVSETGLASDSRHGAVHAFSIERPGGSVELVALGHRSTAGDHPCHLRIDGTGRWLAVANYGSGDVAVFPIMRDGGLGDMASSVQHSGSGPHPDRQQGPHVHSTTFTPDGRFLIVADLGIDRLVVYAFDAATGSLRRHGEMDPGRGTGPRHVAFHPDGRRLFVVNELDNTVALCRYGDGNLVLLQTLSTIPPDAPANLAADIHVSPDGGFIYVSNRGHDSLAVFAFGPAGVLERVAVRPSGGGGPRGFGLTPSGHHALVANRRSNEVTVLPVLAGGADLGAPMTRIEVVQPSCVVFG